MSLKQRSVGNVVEENIPVYSELQVEGKTSD
jgi:hypothetical protein